MALVSKWAAARGLPLIAYPCLPIRRFLVRPIGAAASVPATAHRWAQAYRHALPRPGLFIVQECTTISIRTPFFCVELLAMPPLIRPLRLAAAHLRKAQYRNLVLLPLRRRWGKWLRLVVVVLRCHNLLPIRRRTAELLHSVGEVAVGDIRTHAGTEFAAEFGFEEHFAHGFRGFLGIFRLFGRRDVGSGGARGEFGG